ncbi:hypothetical protein D9758_009440 [Tetrapyrgos nigripes]|uniref:BTB domain-containing protein n=1 Tax=Tetrapyrgos nigripes TaxID=182062 RepID=A0A8H5D1T5_9AGAR|nr:hypothetical protein D9758_009440 [Tetrapyrgos nigripes]
MAYLRQASASPVKHEQYFWDTVTFQVEQVLFKIPRYQLETSSEYFRSMFSGLSAVQLANIDRNPVKLEGITVVEFEPFLEVICPISPWEERTKSTEEWISILKLSTMWRFVHVRRLAIDILVGYHHIDACLKVSLGWEYSVPRWLRMGVYELAFREKTLSQRESQIIGYPLALHVSRVREQAEKNNGVLEFCSSTPAAQAEVETEFKSEFLQAEQNSATFDDPPTLGESYSPPYAVWYEPDPSNISVQLQFYPISCMPAYRGMSFEVSQLYLHFILSSIIVLSESRNCDVKSISVGAFSRDI